MATRTEAAAQAAYEVWRNSDQAPAGNTRHWDHAPEGVKETWRAIAAAVQFAEHTSRPERTAATS